MAKLKKVVPNSLAILTEDNVDDRFERVLLPEKNVGLDMLIDKANEIQQKCYDVPNVPMNSLTMTNDLELIYEGDGFSKIIKLTPYAFSQLCTKLNIPVAYMKKCIDSGMPDLAAENINGWIELNMRKQLLIRMYGKDVVRGILSDRYAICDTPSLLESLAQSDILENMTVKGYMVNPHRFHARFVGDKLKVAGEDLFAGIQIDSSDVGRSRLSVQFLVFKQICTNGLIMPYDISSMYEQKHVGITPELFLENVTEAFKRFKPIVKETTQILTSIKKESALSEDEIKSIVERIITGAKVGKETANNIINLASEKYSTNRWGIVNAITEMSQNYTLEHRIFMERFAGQLLIAG